MCVCVCACACACACARARVRVRVMLRFTDLPSEHVGKVSTTIITVCHVKHIPANGKETLHLVVVILLRIIGTFVYVLYSLCVLKGRWGIYRVRD